MISPASSPNTLIFPAQREMGMGTLTLSQRWPPIKRVALAAGLAPAVWLATLAITGGLGARPIKTGINLTGDWSIYLLLVTLAFFDRPYPRWEDGCRDKM